MTICKICHRPVPDGMECCEDCEKNMYNKADESYLDSLLDSVVAKQPENNNAVNNVSKRRKNTVKASDAANSDENIRNTDNREEASAEPVQTDAATDGQQDDNNQEDMDELLTSLLADMDESNTKQQSENMDNLDLEDISDIFESALNSADANEEQEVYPGDLESMYEADEPEQEAYPGDLESMYATDETEQTYVMPDISVDDDLDSLFQEIGDGADTDFSDNTPDNNDGYESKISETPQTGDVEKEISNVPDKDYTIDVAKKKKKKKSLFSRIFGNIREERTPEQQEEYIKKLHEEEEAQKADKEEKKRKAELTKEQKQAQKERAKEEAAAREQAKAEEAKRKKAELAEKKLKKKEAKLAMQMAEDIDEGKINKIGATILLILFSGLTIFIIVGTNRHSYRIDIEHATEDFNRRRYNDAYYNVYGHDIKNEDIELYDRIMTVMYVNKQLNSYNNYMKMNLSDKALDSLLKGLQRYDKYFMLANELGIRDDLNYVKSIITDRLLEEFELTEAEARDLMVIDDSIDYSDSIYSLLGTYNMGEIK